jgi:hypothetical protein
MLVLYYGGIPCTFFTTVLPIYTETSITDKFREDMRVVTSLLNSQKGSGEGGIG